MTCRLRVETVVGRKQAFASQALMAGSDRLPSDAVQHDRGSLRPPDWPSRESEQSSSRRLRYQFGRGVLDVELGELAIPSCETVAGNPISASHGHASRASRAAGCNPRRSSEHSRRSV